MAKSGRSQSGFQNTHRCCDPLRNEPNQSKASEGNIMIEKHSNDDAKYATDGWHENTEVK